MTSGRWSVAKFSRTIAILEFASPEEWASTDGKQRLIANMEEVFGVGGAGEAVGGLMLHAIYIRNENGDLLLPTIQRMRKEYPLEGEQSDVDDRCPICGGCKKCCLDGSFDG